ncbi:hypothetical protein B0I35DRAFT_141460 [Stachybotrys elegans]|uniref:Uncharacterized protein n=1 Tax=Stachybotrys elegans TaxID=80388 RepID=A0A8K0WVH6_9HYPO|nr:hypothetical protein B0I35DRAFT_141460 [Stachybotrys elegans]
MMWTRSMEHGGQVFFFFCLVRLEISPFFFLLRSCFGLYKRYLVSGRKCPVLTTLHRLDDGLVRLQVYEQWSFFVLFFYSLPLHLSMYSRSRRCLSSPDAHGFATPGRC